MAASDHLSDVQFISHRELAKMNAGDFDVPMPKARREMQREWDEAQPEDRPDFAHPKDVEFGGPDKYLSHLKEDISERGMQEPLEIRNDTVTEGHHRGIAALELGLEQIPVRFRR